MEAFSYPTEVRQRSRGDYLLKARGSLPFLTQSNTPIAAQFRNLAATLCTMDDAPRVIGVTSVLRGEGSTLVAINLALAHATEGERVLFVDADFRHPSIHTLLCPQPRRGLADVLLGETRIEDAVIRPLDTSITILPAGPVPPDPLRLLSSPGMDTILEEARKYFDRVIVDTPAAYPYGEAHVVLPRTDGALLVLRSRHTPRRVFLKTLRLLQPQRVLGLVRNYA